MTTQVGMLLNKPTKPKIVYEKLLLVTWNHAIVYKLLVLINPSLSLL